MAIKLYLDSKESNVFNLIKLENIRALDVNKYAMIIKKVKEDFLKDNPGGLGNCHEKFEQNYLWTCHKRKKESLGNMQSQHGVSCKIST